MISSRRELNGLQLTAKKLGGASASEADQVVVMLVLIEGFDTPYAVAEPNLLRDSALEEEVHRAVNGGVPGGWVNLAHAPNQIIHVDVMFGRQERIEDEVPLLGLLESLTGKIVVEDLF